MSDLQRRSIKSILGQPKLNVVCLIDDNGSDENRKHVENVKRVSQYFKNCSLWLVNWSTYIYFLNNVRPNHDYYEVMVYYHGELVHTVNRPSNLQLLQIFAKTLLKWNPANFQNPITNDQVNSVIRTIPFTGELFVDIQRRIKGRKREQSKKAEDLILPSSSRTHQSPEKRTEISSRSSSIHRHKITPRTSRSRNVNQTSSNPPLSTINPGPPPSRPNLGFSIDSILDSSSSTSSTRVTSSRFEPKLTKSNPIFSILKCCTKTRSFTYTSPLNQGGSSTLSTQSGLLSLENIRESNEVKLGPLKEKKAYIIDEEQSSSSNDSPPPSPHRQPQPSTTVSRSYLSTPSGWNIDSPFAQTRPKESRDDNSDNSSSINKNITKSTGSVRRNQHHITTSQISRHTPTLTYSKCLIQQPMTSQIPHSSSTTSVRSISHTYYTPRGSAPISRAQKNPLCSPINQPRGVFTTQATGNQSYLGHRRECNIVSTADQLQNISSMKSERDSSQFTENSVSRPIRSQPRHRRRKQCKETIYHFKRNTPSPRVQT